MERCICPRNAKTANIAEAAGNAIDIAAGGVDAGDGRIYFLHPVIVRVHHPEIALRVEGDVLHRIELAVGGTAAAIATCGASAGKVAIGAACGRGSATVSGRARSAQAAADFLHQGAGGPADDEFFYPVCVPIRDPYRGAVGVDGNSADAVKIAHAGGACTGAGGGIGGAAGGIAVDRGAGRRIDISPGAAVAAADGLHPRSHVLARVGAACDIAVIDGELLYSQISNRIPDPQIIVLIKRDGVGASSGGV